MAQRIMYDGLTNSPITTITNSLSATDTIIYVLDDSKIPTPPNLLVIGGNLQSAETVKLIEKDGNKLTVERGFQGTAIPWNTGATIARNFTEYDYRAFKENIEDLEANKATKTEVQETSNKIGILSNLPTTEKSNLVGAISEVNELLSNETTARQDTDELKFDKTGGTVSGTIIDTSYDALKMGATETSGQRIVRDRGGDLISTLALDFGASLTSAQAIISMFQSTNTSGEKRLDVYAGDGTSTVKFRINGGLIDILNGKSVKITAGTGSPEGAVTAPIGSIYLRSDGGTSTTLYVKQSGTGNTGWVAK